MVATFYCTSHPSRLHSWGRSSIIIHSIMAPKLVTHFQKGQVSPWTWTKYKVWCLPLVSVLILIRNRSASCTSIQSITHWHRKIKYLKGRDYIMPKFGWIQTKAQPTSRPRSENVCCDRNDVPTDSCTGWKTYSAFFLHWCHLNYANFTMYILWIAVLREWHSLQSLKIISYIQSWAYVIRL